MDYSLFDNCLWPTLAERVKSFESLKVNVFHLLLNPSKTVPFPPSLTPSLQLQGAWAGFYDYNTYDQNAIIGPHPVISNLIFVNGFSGHGIQQSPAAGLAVSELIVDGRTHTIDLGVFSFSRVTMMINFEMVT